VAPRGNDDDRPTVDLGPRPPDASEFADEPPTVIDDPSLAPAPPVDPVHHQPTQPLGPRAPGPHRTASSATASPVDAMKLDELGRTRVFLKAALAITGGGVIVAVATTGDPVAKVVVLIGSGMAALAALYLWWLLRDPANYQPKKLFAPALPILLGSMSGVYYWGAGSPVAALLVYGIYFFSLGSDRRLTGAMYGLVAAIHGVLGLGILSGVLADHGVVRVGGLPAREQVAILCIIEVLYFVAYYTARISQRVTLDAMSKLEQAVRGNAQRDALLAEAK
jgi:hypothetical protein